MSELKTLHDTGTIQRRLDALAAQIDRDYAGKTLDVVYMLNGASVFAADLVRRLKTPVKLYPFGFTSYPKPSPSGEIRVTLDVADALQGRDVLLVEGVVVSGRTPKYLFDTFQLRQPASLAMAAIGVKPKALAVDLKVAYPAFEFGGEVVVGFGVGEGAEKALPYLAARS